jgi:hypothetical protein
VKKKFNTSNIPVFFLAFSFLLILIVACSKEPVREQVIDPDPDPGDTTKPPLTFKKGVFVINEGNYNWGNASVTFIDDSSSAVVQDIFEKANSRNLGDVAESMKIVNNLGYLVVNNSNRIEVVSLKDFKVVTSITGLYYPRFLEVIDSTKAYVTNLKRNVSVIDLKTNTVKGTIKTSTWTESLLRYGQFMLVTSIGTFSEPSANRQPHIFIIDTRSDLIVDSIQTGKEPVGIVIDRKDKVWVLCSGGYDNYEAASLLRINPELRIVEKVFTFPNPKETPSKLCINHSGDTLYFLKNGVYQMPVNAAGIPESALIPSNGRLLYGLNLHPVSGHIYVSDAKDYVQNGTVYRYTVKGALLNQYPVGRIPGSFCFSDQ